MTTTWTPRPRLCTTVSQLKALIADWPEFNRDGEPTEVWIETGKGLSSQCGEALPLNLRTNDDGSLSADLILEPRP